MPKRIQGGAAAAAAGGQIPAATLFRRLRIPPVSFLRKLLDAILCGTSREPRRSTNPTSPKPILLSDLLNAPDDDEQYDEISGDAVERVAIKKIRAFNELQDAVRRLQTAGQEAAVAAAAEVRILAKYDPHARETLALLGAIPALVAMLDSGGLRSQISALYALLNLSIANAANKGAIVTAGALPKIIDLILRCDDRSPPSLREALVAVLLCLTALDTNKQIIGSSPAAVSFLVTTVCSTTAGGQARIDALRALYNLSLIASNISHLISAGTVPAALFCFGDMEVSDWALTVLENIAVSSEGQRAVRKEAGSVAALADVLYWSDAPACRRRRRTC